MRSEHDERRMSGAPLAEVWTALDALDVRLDDLDQQFGVVPERSRPAWLVELVELADALEAGDDLPGLDAEFDRPQLTVIQGGQSTNVDSGGEGVA